MQINPTIIINIFSSLLCVCLGLSAAFVFWQGYGYWSPPNTANNTFFAIDAKPRPQKPLSKEPHYADEIGSAHLFGQPLAVKNIVPVVAAMPESQLSVVIKGILALADEGRSIAILSVGNAKDKVFKVGAELTKGYSLHQIVADGIVLDHEGSLEIIRLPRASMQDITTKTAAASKDQHLGANGDLSLAKLRATVMGNPLSLEQHIAFVPYTIDGQFAGYRVNQGSKPHLFGKLGLKANDVVISIDGVGIGQLAGRLDILTNLSAAQNLRLGVIRDGAEQQLFVDFNQ